MVKTKNSGLVVENQKFCGKLFKKPQSL